MARRFGVSTTPIREILNKLADQGFIERRKKAGSALRNFTFVEIRDAYDLRSVLEGLAARLACARPTVSLVKKLKALEKVHGRALREHDVSLADETDIKFHSCIIDFSGNVRLAQLVRDFHLVTKTVRLIPGMDPMPKSLKETPYPHEKIIAAIREGNPEKAERIARRHVEWAKENTLRRYLGWSQR